MQFQLLDKPHTACAVFLTPVPMLSLPGLQADASGLNLLRSPSFQKKERAGQGLSDGLPPAGPNQSSEANPERDPVSIIAKSTSLRDHVPISRAQLLGGLGEGGNSGSPRSAGKNSLSLKHLPDSVRARLAASQEAAAAASNGSNDSGQVLGRQLLAKKSSPVVAERSFSF